MRTLNLALDVIKGIGIILVMVTSFVLLGIYVMLGGK